MKLFRNINITKFVFVWIISGILFYNFSFIPASVFCSKTKMKKCCCMENSENGCKMNTIKNCNSDLKGNSQKSEEKILVMHLNVIPKLSNLYSTSVDDNFKNQFLNSVNNSFLYNIPLNSQGVYITISNLRI